MGSTGHFKSVTTATGVPVAVSNAYLNRVQLDLPLKTLIHSSLYIYLDTIAGGATTTTVRITSDTGGDECLVPDTTATISPGHTTATDGTTVYKIDIVVPATTTTVYCLVKLDAGTANVNRVVLTGLE